MNRRLAPTKRGDSAPRWFVWSLLAATAAAGIVLTASWRGQATHSWNVVLITLDTTRADRLGCYGSRNETPTIDNLARQGVRFDRCYCAVPLTLPSHCSLMTGLMPIRHGAYGNGPDRLDPRAETLAESLARHGYVTAAVLGAFVLDRRFGLDQGFDHYDDRMPESADRNPFGSTQRSAAQVTDAALAWLDKRPAGPIFLWVHYFDPHAPYAAPGYNPSFATVSPYDAEIGYVDSQLKRLLDGVQQRLGDETLVILTADHGESLGQHGELTHGLFAYDATLRVPLVVRFPDRRGAGRVIQSPVSLIDVVPSLLAWLGLEEDGQWDGVPLPLVNIVDNDAPASRRPIYFENRYPTLAFGWSGIDGIVAGRYKFIRAPKSELYDLKADPGERTNLFEVASDRAAEYLAALETVRNELSARPAIPRQAADITGADVRRLQSLGYVGERTAQGDTASTPNNLPDAKDMIHVYTQLQEIAVLAQQRQINRAIEMLLQILESRDPANPRALRWLAALALDEPAFHDRAVACIKQAVAHGDRPVKDPFVLGKLGVSLMADERFSEAAEVFGRLVEFEPQSAAAWQYLADAHGQMGDAAQSARWRQRALELAHADDEQPDWAAVTGPQRALVPSE